jgi:hypothetical protein
MKTGVLVRTLDIFRGLVQPALDSLNAAGLFPVARREIDLSRELAGEARTKERSVVLRARDRSALKFADKLLRDDGRSEEDKLKIAQIVLDYFGLGNPYNAASEVLPVYAYCFKREPAIKPIVAEALRVVARNLGEGSIRDKILERAEFLDGQK